MIIKTRIYTMEYSNADYTSYLTMTGMIIFTMVILLANLKIISFSNNFSFISLFIVFGSIFIYFVVMIIVDKHPSLEMYDEISR